MVKYYDKLLCWNCRHLVKYKIESRSRTRTYGDKTFDYIEKFATCLECGEEITVPGLDDENEQVAEEVWRKVKNGRS